MLMAYLVSGRYGNPAGEEPVRMAAAPAKTGWVSRFFAMFSHKR